MLTTPRFSFFSENNLSRGASCRIHWDCPCSTDS